MADFTDIPNFGVTCKSRYNTETQKYENEDEETRLITSKKLRTWENLLFTPRTSAQLATAIAFFDTVHEDLDSFTMEIDGEEVTGKIDKGSFWHRRIAPAVYEYGFTFREVP